METIIGAYIGTPFPTKNQTAVSYRVPMLFFNGLRGVDGPTDRGSPRDPR